MLTGAELGGDRSIFAFTGIGGGARFNLRDGEASKAASEICSVGNASGMFSVGDGDISLPVDEELGGGRSKFAFTGIGGGARFCFRRGEESDDIGM